MKSLKFFFFNFVLPPHGYVMTVSHVVLIEAMLGLLYSIRSHTNNMYFMLFRVGHPAIILSDNHKLTPASVSRAEPGTGISLGEWSVWCPGLRCPLFTF